MKPGLVVIGLLIVLSAGCPGSSLSTDSDGGGGESTDGGSGGPTREGADAGLDGPTDGGDLSGEDAGREDEPTDAGLADGPPDAGPADAGSGVGDGVGDGDGDSMDGGAGAEDGATPPAYPAYSGGTCPTFEGGPSIETSLVTGFMSGDDERSFRLLVPESYDGSEAYPLVVAWHGSQVPTDAYIEQMWLDSAVAENDFIAVLPAADPGEYLFDWPTIESGGYPKEMLFLDDLLACVTEQFNVDKSRVYATGMSAGALLTTYMSMTERAEYFAAIGVLSGGLGSALGIWEMEWAPPPRKFPALVMWGGPTDTLVVNFNTASTAYRDHLLEEGHFVVTCEHEAGHNIPALTLPEDGRGRFTFLWDFLLAHTYGTPAGTSPLEDSGLPAWFPEWCSIE